MTNKVWNLIDSKNLVYCTEWETAESSVRAMVFAKMVELSRDRVKFYVSDLYHDALWLSLSLNGPMQFEWVARESGTFIGESASVVKDDDWSDSVRYRFEIINEDGRWVLNTYQSVLDIGDWREEIPGTGLNYYGDPVTNEDDNSDGTFTEDDQGNWHEVNPVNNIINEIFGIGNPTLRNEMEEETPNYLIMGETDDFGTPVPAVMSKIIDTYAPRKENKMDSILYTLREKLDEATQARDDLEDLQRELENAIETANQNIDSLEEAINALDINLEDIEFEADVRFDGSY